MYKKNLLNSPRLIEIRKKKLKILRRNIILIFIGLILVFIAFVFVTRIKSLNIFEVNITGNKIIDTKDINEVIQNNLSGKYIWLIPKTNFLFLPKDKIRLELADKYKRLKDIKVNVTSNKILEVSTAERSGLFTWCGDELPIDGTKPEEVKCYFMDDTGYIFDEAPYFSNDVYIKFFGINSKGDSANPAGAYFLKDNFVNFVKFIDNITNEYLKPSSVFINNENEIEIYLSSNILPPLAPKILTNQDSDFIKLAENLKSAVTTKPLEVELKEKYDKLLYIDLRFGNRVYYKFK